jgi:hypothetical protein
MTYVPVSCPYCGEPSELAVDDDGGARQRFVHDCPVCCQPWDVEAVRDREGDWSATARSGDE